MTLGSSITHTVVLGVFRPNMFEPNSALAPFNEPEVALTINHWPQTWGWYCLLVAGVILGLLKIHAQMKKWWRNRYRREALRRLQHTASQPMRKRLLAAHELLKIVSVYLYGREMIAPLNDTDWYDLLNGSVDTPTFTKEQQSSVHQALYGGLELTETDIYAYLSAVESWLKMHRLEREDD